MSDTREPSVRVECRNDDGTLHWNLLMLRLGPDEHGSWLGSPAASNMRKDDGPPVLAQPHVIFFQSGAWYTAAFNGEPAKSGEYRDLITPPTRTLPDLVRMVDLDVLRRRDESQALPVDEYGFAEHEMRCGYLRDVVDAAQSAARRLYQAATARTAAFTGVRRVGMAKATALGAGA